MSIEAFQKERKTFSSMFSSVNTATDDRGDATLLKSGTAGNKVPTADDEADV